MTGVSYQTRLYGFLKIEPPISWAEVRGDNHLLTREQGNRSCLLLLLTEDPPEDVAEGQLRRRYVSTISHHGSVTVSGNLVEQALQEILNRYGADRTVSGRIIAEGADFGDLWQLVVRDGRAVREQARIVWPDGSEEPVGDH